MKKKQLKRIKTKIEKKWNKMLRDKIKKNNEKIKDQNQI